MQSTKMQSTKMQSTKMQSNEAVAPNRRDMSRLGNVASS